MIHEVDSLAGGTGAGGPSKISILGLTERGRVCSFKVDRFEEWLVLSGQCCHWCGCSV